MSKKIFMIAGEPSGDALGAGLIKAIKQREGAPTEIIGIGGDFMKEQGLESMLPMEELCVMGLWEVISHLPRLLRLINGVVEEIEKQKPDVVITIDLPDFNFQVAARLKKRGIFKGKVIHYVAPSVWAWRPKRAQKVSKFLDGLMCLFPFEPPYFEKHELPSKFIGHSLVERKLEDISAQRFREKYEIEPDERILGVFLGSRESELKKHAKVFNEAIDFLKERYPELVIVMPTLPSLEYEVKEVVKPWRQAPIIVMNQDHKYDAFAACDVAIAVSGTVGLELAYIGVPHIIAYKTHPLTYLIARLLIKVKYVHLANILLDDAVVPEYLQGKCSAVHLSKALLKLLKFKEARYEQIEDFQELRKIMSAAQDKTPSEKGADFIFDILDGTYKPEPIPELPKRTPKAAEKEEPKNPPQTDSKDAAGEDNQEGEVQGINLPELIDHWKEKLGLNKDSDKSQVKPQEKSKDE